MAETIVVQERGQTLAFSFADLLRYAGPHSPAGVATAFKVMQRAFPLVSPNGPPPRRSIVVRTAFQGPGARDGFEAATRAFTGGRYTVDVSLARPDLGRRLQSFVFNIAIGERSKTLLLREGFVTDEFIDLAGKPDRSTDDELHLDELKAELAARLIAAPATEVCDVCSQSAD